MKRTRFITFPRSGHHHLIKLISGVAKGPTRYCEIYREPDRTFDKDLSTRIEKHHDFDLKLPYDDGYEHIIQIRAPRPAIDSWQKKFGGEWDDKAKFYKAWLKKWVTDNPDPDPLIVTYESLVLAPRDTVKRVCERMGLVVYPDALDALKPSAPPSWVGTDYFFLP